MKPDDALEILREAHREPIPEAHFAAVRARVLSQIAAGHNRPRRWLWVYALAAAAAVLGLAFWPKASTPQPVRPVIARGLAEAYPQPAPLSVIQRPQLARVSHGRRTIRRRPLVTAVVGPFIRQPLVVKVLTNDPDVVIYWISEGTGE